MFRSAVVFCALLALATAFLLNMSLYHIPENFKDQKGCYIPELNAVLPFGQRFPSIDSCVEIRCENDYLSVTGCSAVIVGPPCKVVEPLWNEKDILELLYPNCCPTIECPPQD